MQDVRGQQDHHKQRGGFSCIRIFGSGRVSGRLKGAVGKLEGRKVRRCEGGNRAERDRLERSDSREAGSPGGEINVGKWEGRKVERWEGMKVLTFTQGVTFKL